MPFLQTEYKNRMDPARPGMLHGSDNDVFTGIAAYDDSDLPMELGYPLAVKAANGAGAQPIVSVGSLTAANFAGITIRDITLLNAVNSPAGDVYMSGQNVGVLRRGSIWVAVVGAAAVINTGAFFNATTGVIQATGGTAIPGSRWMTRGEIGQYAILHISGQKA